MAGLLIALETLPLATKPPLLKKESIPNTSIEVARKE